MLQKGSIVKKWKRKALPGGINAKLRARLRSLQAEKLRRQKKPKLSKRAAFQKTTHGETAGQAFIRLETNPKHRLMTAEEKNLAIGTAGVNRIINASGVSLSRQQAKQVLGPAGIIMEHFAKRVPDPRKLWEYFPSHRPWKKFRIRGKETPVYIEKFSIPDQYAKRRPDRVVQIINEKLDGVPFIPPAPGEIVDGNLTVLSRMTGEFNSKVTQRYKVLGWILFESFVQGRGSSHHLQTYLQKFQPKKLKK